MKPLTCQRFGLVLAILATTATARAQSADDVAAAETLFKSARDLVEGGNWADGCPKFQAALALHASASTQLNIARCHEHDGRTASAWAAYKRALVLNRETLGAERQRTLEELAKSAILALEPTLARLRLRAPRGLSGLEVTRDGVSLPAGVFGEALPVDPGEHRIEARATGRLPFTRTFTATAGALVEIDVAFDSAPATSKHATLPRHAPPRGSAESGAPEPVPTWAWVSGGAGVVLIGAGIGFLLDDLSAIGRLRDHCDESGARTTCEPGYDYAADNARKNRGFALFVGLSAAGTAAVTASVIGIVGARGSRAQSWSPTPVPWLSRGGAGAFLTGAF